MCSTAMLARASLFLCLVVGSRQLSITELVVPLTLEAGENAELQCRFDSGDEPKLASMVKWWWTSLSGQRAQLYQRIGDAKGSPVRHGIETKDNDTIVLLETTPANSGEYECEVSMMTEKLEEVRLSQNLTIFTQGSGPNLTVTEVDDGPAKVTKKVVLVQCRADDVAPAPNIMLRIDGEEISVKDNITGPDSAGLYDIFVNVTLTKDSVDGREVHCELFYDNRNVLHPPYFDAMTYNPSSALEATVAPGNATESDSAAPDSLQNPSDDSSQARFSWVLLFVLGLLTQVSAFFESSM